MVLYFPGVGATCHASQSPPPSPLACQISCEGIRKRSLVWISTNLFCCNLDGLIKPSLWFRHRIVWTYEIDILSYSRGWRKYRESVYTNSWIVWMYVSLLFPKINLLNWHFTGGFRFGADICISLNKEVVANECPKWVGGGHPLSGGGGHPPPTPPPLINRYLWIICEFL